MSHTHIEQGNYTGKHPEGSVGSDAVSVEIEKRAVDTHLSCRSAEAIAGELKVSMEEIGKCADLLEIKVDKCQLGLFGYTRSKDKKRIMEPLTAVEPRLKEAIENVLVDGRLSCTAAWGIASDLGVSRMEVCAGADSLGIKTTACQLGTF